MCDVLLSGQRGENTTFLSLSVYVSISQTYGSCKVSVQFSKLS